MAIVEFEYPGSDGKNPQEGAYSEEDALVTFDKESGQIIVANLYDLKVGKWLVVSPQARLSGEIALSGSTQKRLIERSQELDDPMRSRFADNRLEHETEVVFNRLIENLMDNRNPIDPGTQLEAELGADQIRRMIDEEM